MPYRQNYIVYNNIRKFSTIPGISHFVVGGKDALGFHLYDVCPDGAVEKVDDYTSSGSGSILVYGLLEAQFKKDMKMEDGIKLAIKGLTSAINRDIASGNGCDVMTITDKGVKKVLTKELKITLED